MTDEKAIRELQRTWFQATIDGDIDVISDLMTDDVVFLTPGRAPFGKQEFIQSFKTMKDHVAIDCDGEYIEILINGDTAYATSRLAIQVTPKKGGTAKLLAGHALSVYQRCSDANWRLARDANMVTPTEL